LAAGKDLFWCLEAHFTQRHKCQFSALLTQHGTHAISNCTKQRCVMQIVKMQDQICHNLKLWQQASFCGSLAMGQQCLFLLTAHAGICPGMHHCYGHERQQSQMLSDCNCKLRALQGFTLKKAAI